MNAQELYNDIQTKMQYLNNYSKEGRSDKDLDIDDVQRQYNIYRIQYNDREEKGQIDITGYADAIRNIYIAPYTVRQLQYLYNLDDTINKIYLNCIEYNNITEQNKFIIKSIPWNYEAKCIRYKSDIKNCTDADDYTIIGVTCIWTKLRATGSLIFTDI